MPHSSAYKTVLQIAPHDSARLAAERMRNDNVGCLVIVDEDRPVGMLTDRDLMLGILHERRDPDQVTVEEIMSKPLVTIDTLASLSDASRLMRSKRIRRLPIVDDDGKLVGIQTADDVIELIGHRVSDLASGMRKGMARDDAAGVTPDSVYGKE